MGLSFTCVFVMSISRSCGGKKMALDPVKFEVQMAVSCHLGAGNQPPFLERLVSAHHN